MATTRQVSFAYRTKGVPVAFWFHDVIGHLSGSFGPLTVLKASDELDLIASPVVEARRPSGLSYAAACRAISHIAAILHITPLWPAHDAFTGLWDGLKVPDSPGFTYLRLHEWAKFTPVTSRRFCLIRA